jgi:hypothetical protein
VGWTIDPAHRASQYRLRRGSVAEEGATTMDANTAEKLERLISQLDAQILVLEDLNIPGTRLLLAMARLDLQATRHSIDHGELKTLCETVQHALENAGGTDRERRPAAFPRRGHARLGAARRRARSLTLSSLA